VPRAQVCGFRVPNGRCIVNAAEHSHEPSSDSELVKHLKSIIKVPRFVSLLVSGARNAEMRIAHFDVTVVVSVSKWSDQCS